MDLRSNANMDITSILEDYKKGTLSLEAAQAALAD